MPFRGKPWYRVTWDDLFGPWGCLVLAVGFAIFTVWYAMTWGVVFGTLGPALLTASWSIGAIVQFRRRARRVPTPATST